MMNEWCNSTWIQGYALDIKEDCKATLSKCEDFVSMSAYDHVAKKSDKSTLKIGNMCVVTIDATGFIAHAGFKGTANLGVMYNGYKNGKNITIAQGSTLEITLYNGAKDVGVEIDYIFTGANHIKLGLFTFIAASLIGMSV